MPKMSANVYVIEDYENEPPSGPKKTNPIQTQFLKRPKSIAGKSGKFAIRKILGIFQINPIYI